jgi:hypothetical protein
MEYSESHNGTVIVLKTPSKLIGTASKFSQGWKVKSYISKPWPKKNSKLPGPDFTNVLWMQTKREAKQKLKELET